jgi:NAD+ synthase (glutamine-hydrolysing)
METTRRSGSTTTDLAWDGQTMIWQNGVCLAQSERFPKGTRRSVADSNLELLSAERLRTTSLAANRRHHEISENSFRKVPFMLEPSLGGVKPLCR